MFVGATYLGILAQEQVWNARAKGFCFIVRSETPSAIQGEQSSELSKNSRAQEVSKTEDISWGVISLMGLFKAMDPEETAHIHERKWEHSPSTHS